MGITWSASRPVAPVSKMVVLLSDAKSLPDQSTDFPDQRSEHPFTEKGLPDQRSEHPFTEKGPWRQGCEAMLASSLLPSLVIVSSFFVGIAALTIVGVLDDPAIHGSAVIVGYVSFEVLTVRVARMSYVQRFLQPLSSTLMSCVLMHTVFIWYVVATQRSPAQPPTPHQLGPPPLTQPSPLPGMPNPRPFPGTSSGSFLSGACGRPIASRRTSCVYSTAPLLLPVCTAITAPVS